MKTTYNLIQERRTIRSFQKQKVPKRLLKACINAARLAPSSENKQPLKYIIITKELNRVFDTTNWAAYIKSGRPKEGKQPTAYLIVISDIELNNNARYDVGLAVENIILTALEQGVASCILGSFDKEKLRENLKVPPKYLIELVVALGYPDQESYVVGIKDGIRYWRDKVGDQHVPKRKLKDVIIEEGFK